MVRIPRKTAKRIDGYVTKYMGILEVAGDRPQIKAYDHRPEPFWLGRTSPRLAVDEDTGELVDITTTMDLQKLLFKDQHQHLLERVVAHEMIHHRDFVAKMTPEEKARVEAILAANDDGEFHRETESDRKEDAARVEEEISDEHTKATHGPSFWEGAARINAVMGPDFVQESEVLVREPKDKARSAKLAILGVGAAALLASALIRRRRRAAAENQRPPSMAIPSPQREQPSLRARPPRQNERGHYGKR